MKRLLFFAISYFSLATYAQDKMDMTCVTEYPTTSFVIREEADTVVVEVFNHNGNKFMPIFDGLATPNDVALLAHKAQVLSSLPTIQRYEWQRSQCEIQDEMIESCHGNTTEQTIDGHKVSAWSLTTSWSTEKTSFGKFNSRKVVLNLSIDGSSYSIPMKYEENECAPTVMLTGKSLKEKKAIH